ncbi:MAG: type IV secretion system DotC family protein [Gammaproteobacteria bacterium]|nr:type IV secretion system DotC family protein [Gammaproteobacteria bacterium]
MSKHNNLFKKIIPIIAACFLAGCSSSSCETPEELSKIAALKATETCKINELRASVLKQTAREMGAQAGLAWQSRHINTILNKQKTSLDHIFNFNYMLLNKNVLPPVLVEGRNTLNLSDEYTIRISDHDYQIAYPPRFVTAPPTWRDYIWMSYKKPETPNGTLLPKNKEERSLWNEYINKGWNEGIMQADSIFSANLNRLKRDFDGMVLYRKLLAENMVTPPFVAEADLGVTGGGTNMRINDRILRITTIPELKATPKKWKPVLEGTRSEHYDTAGCN